MRCWLPWTSEAARVLRREHAHSPSPASGSRAICGDACRSSTTYLGCPSCDPLFLAENQLGCAAGNHMSRRICRTCNDPRHDGGVGHAQARKAVHAKLWVDDREIIHAHFACADGMSEARRAKPDKFPDLLGGRLGAGHDFDLARTAAHATVCPDGGS